MRSRIRQSVALVATILCVLITARTAEAKKDETGPRPISRAEAAAVEIVADFLARGPIAVQERLAPEAPLSTLSKDESLAEIEARTGPPDGSEWHLQTIVPSLADHAAVFGVEFPSGIDDVIELNLVEHDGRFEVLGIRSLAEPSPYAVIPDWMEEDVEQGEAAPPPFSLLDHLLLLGVLIALLSIAALALLRVRPVYGRIAGATTVAVCLVSLHFIAADLVRRVPDEGPGSADRAAAAKIDRLGSLLAQRQALASGDPVASQSSGNSVAARDVAAIWKAQVELRDQKLDEATKTLEHFPLATDRPMVALLRARLAAAAYDEIASSLAYERAMRLGPGRDDLWFETAEWLFALGFEDRAVGYLNRLPAMRSRNAAAYYALASVSGVGAKRTEAVSFLRTAWDLEPAPRAQLISTPALTFALRRGGETTLIPFSSAVEPAFRTSPDPERLIELPDNAETTVSGAALSIRTANDAVLKVDGGAVLVGPDAEIIDAVTADRRQEERYLRDFQSLLAAGVTATTLAQPVVRERYLRTASALAGRHRWGDVERLTVSLSAAAENVPPDLLFLRGTALRKLRRDEEARRLLADMVKSPAMERRTDPRILYQLGEMLAAMELYTPAIRTLERVDAMMDDLSLDDRIRQLSMNKRLAERYTELTTRNFVIHYPDNIDDAAAQRFSEIMEAELARLRKILPVREFRPTTVNIVWWNEFRNTYTGSDHILGFYDGKITLPLAGVARLSPSIVAIMTHELAHAVIAQATDDRASAWMQEGLAQRVEMVPYHANAFNMYESDHLLPITLLDPALTHAVDGDLIGQAYITSQTVVRFLESKYGAKIVPSLLEAVRDGQSDEAALASLTGKTIEELEVEFREWGRADRRVFENRGIIRYDGADEPSVRFSKRSPGAR